MNKFKYNQFMYKNNHKHSKVLLDSSENGVNGFSGMEEHVGFYHQQISYNHFRFFLDNDIEENSKYREIIQVLISATQGDIVELMISNSGGFLSTTISLINAIRQSEAFVRAVIMSEAHSASSFISVACDDSVALPHSRMLIHNPRCGSFGNFNEVVKNNEFFEKHIKNFYLDVYKDFLSEDEINDVLEGKDLWLTSDEFNQRIEKRNEKIRLQQEQEEREREELISEQEEEIFCENTSVKCDSLGCEKPRKSSTKTKKSNEPVKKTDTKK